MRGRWGESSRKSLQQQRRRELAAVIADHLLDVLDPEHCQMVEEIIPRGNLRKHALKRMLSFVTTGEWQGRGFTLRMCKQVMRVLIRKLRFDVPSMSFQSKQAARLQFLLQRAKRLRASRPKAGAQRLAARHQSNQNQT